MWLHLQSQAEILKSSQIDPSKEQLVRQWLGRKAPSLEVIPVINNFDEIQKRWRGEELGALLSSLGGRSALATRLSNYADAKSLGGLLIDFEGLLPEQQNGLIELTRLLTGMMHERGKRLLVFVPAGDDAYDTARTLGIC